MSQEETETEEVSLNSSRISVTLGRRSMKFIDIKGSIAELYSEKGYKIGWQQETDFSDIPTLNDRLIITSSDESDASSALISFDRLAYTANVQKPADIRNYVGNLIELLKDVDQELLNIKKYQFLLLNVNFPISEHYGPFTLLKVLKLNVEQSTEIIDFFVPNGVLLRFKGINTTKNFEYYLSLSNVSSIESDNQVQPTEGVNIDFNLRQSGTWVLEELEAVIQDLIDEAISLTRKFSDKVLL